MERYKYFLEKRIKLVFTQKTVKQPLQAMAESYKGYKRKEMKKIKREHIEKLIRKIPGVV